MSHKVNETRGHDRHRQVISARGSLPSRDVTATTYTNILYPCPANGDWSRADWPGGVSPIGDVTRPAGGTEGRTTSGNRRRTCCNAYCSIAHRSRCPGWTGAYRTELPDIGSAWPVAHRPKPHPRMDEVRLDSTGTVESIHQH